MDLFWAICGLGAGSGLPLAGGMFVAGLLGGAGHCSLMCGSFVIAQVAERFADGARMRLWTAVLLPYQLGRLATYSALGSFAGGIGAAAAWLVDLSWLPAAALAVGAAVFALQAFGRLGFGPSIVTRLGRGTRGFTLGLALGFLPCGLVYGALIAAAGAGGAWQGALALASFGLGTVPALVAVAWLGLAAGKRWLALAQSAAPFAGFANAVVLGALAVRSL